MQTLLIAAAYIGMTIYLANLEEATDQENAFVRPALYGLAALMFALGLNLLALSGVAPELLAEAEMPRIDTGMAVIAMILTTILSGLSIGLVRSVETRRLLQRLLAREPGRTPAYNPDSIVHTAAVVIALALVTWIVIGFLTVGGTEGLAANLSDAPPTINETVFFALISLLVAFLGVGLYMRRSLPDALKRLGLRWPVQQDLVIGTLAGFGLFVGATVAISAWQFVASPEIVEQQTAASDQILNAFSGSLLAGVILAASAGISEEILFRGALQPVFGVVGSSLLFSLSHLQYTLTPASFIIFFISLGFAWVRRNTSTTAAIIAHFTYNLIPFLLIALASTLEAGAG